jgi:hypothetical protein
MLFYHNIKGFTKSLLYSKVMNFTTHPQLILQFYSSFSCAFSFRDLKHCKRCEKFNAGLDEPQGGAKHFFVRTLENKVSNFFHLSQPTKKRRVCAK